MTVEGALRNTTVFRSVSLLSNSIAMLPLHLFEAGTARRKADAHPLFRVLHRRPNDWQTAFEFRQLMQAWALLYGNAYALKIMRGDRVVGLAPMDPRRVEVRQGADMSLHYTFCAARGGQKDLAAHEVFHLRGFTLDGLRGLSLVRQAADAIGLAASAQTAAARLYRSGMMAGGAIEMPDGQLLSQEAYERLQDSMADREGAENAGRWIVLEQGAKAKTFSDSASDNQHLENRRLQIEEIARVFGIPRPLLMIDDTSWGSGIDVLGQLFVRYGLNPWFQAWEQAITRDLLSERDAERYYPKFNAGGLLRGSMKDQAEFFAKALGAGGHHPWMHPQEARDWLELPPRDDLPPSMAAAKGARHDDQTSA
ncbi:MAG: phage portal protein [Paracoccus sp. (in: a-proteobacteria)]|nr:phage portal protein [Paracoccus sp. (in: a-proteobacteria)]